MQNTHGPFQVPEEYSSLYNFEGNPKLNVFNGMISVVDSAVGNLTAALKARPGTWDNTIVRPRHSLINVNEPSFQPRAIFLTTAL